MSCYDFLVGQPFRLKGTDYTVVECDGSVVLAAAVRDGGSVEEEVPLALVLEALEVQEITVTELPPADDDPEG